MAATNSNISSDSPTKKEDEFNEFYSEVKEIEKRDSVLTPKQQIDRLLRPGSSYFNLNPFEVLQIDPSTSIDEIKKKYRRMSILVHPDKNQDDAERAQQAFEIVNKAWKTLENEETRAKCMDVIEEAKARTDHMIAEKKKKMKKEGKTESANILEEETEEGYKHAVWVMTMKLFADMERRRRELATRDAEQRKRKREEELSAEAQAALEREWQKNFEESRQSRVDSWKAFQSGANATKQKKAKKLKAFRPPKTKAESR
ncbi:dnaJ homolog subfamily C member 8 [Apis laboriosa]|uniref:DnaJ homolog subfamily C member 8 n=1 Tax=Apis mellifera TaxID=7460 RepID=A0A7M7GNV8_APIME|nr:dnaJ homolog subfamily C member 8 [Apis mellifera]XP_006613570.1 dnaJ homolog subfamily C member 8 [Apis dorsata]XP_012350634.1 dnaJ homolog subfamily C member 8 [Apis florea]XP_043784643.1 dnaJ homolog subfamily C member 8 [Apis laboriosa]KAG6802377.1 dnaJ subfamily C member 8 [Apis mellifera caucasica]KAG9435629.1 dnaJ subfamily C member 8 [Apis mellifera carnica]|eukprot:XP_006558850.1 dnaJ homolog subfamily C member 8 [Apis mellifera]